MMIKEITKNEYIQYINSSINYLKVFSNNTINYLDNIESIIIEINFFQIDILYDIIDNIEEAKKIFKNFCFLLFDSISKGINSFKYNLMDHIEDIIGNLLYITRFVADGIKNNEISQNSMPEEIRSEIIIKLNDFQIIINSIVNQLVEEIMNDYKKEMLNSNPQGITFFTNSEVSELLENIRNNSDNLIDSIKFKIEYIEKYELYITNINKINEINYRIQNIIHNKGMESLKNLINIKPDFMDESSDIIKSKNNLFNISIKIKNEINNEIDEINNYISTFSNNYKDKHIYKMHLTLYYFKQSFSENKIIALYNRFIGLIDNIINIEIKKIIKNNYNLAFEYLEDENKLFSEYRDGTWGTGDNTVNFLGIDTRRQMITNTFISKYYKFIEYFNLFLNNVHYSSELTNIFKESFYSIKEEIINYVKYKLLKINTYLFDDKLYEGNFYFLKLIQNEILKIIEVINNYFSEEIFEGKIYIYIFDTIINNLISFDENLAKELEEKFNDLSDRSNKIENTDKDFCYAKWKWFKWRKTCLYSEHTNNIDKVTKDLGIIKVLIKQRKTIILGDFEQNFNVYLNLIIDDSNNLYSNLNLYFNKKINNNNDNINKFLEEYQNILYDMSENYSNKKLFDKLYINQIKLLDENINIMINEIKNEIEKIRFEYYDYYYQINKTEFLEYPYEIIIKCNQILDELKNNSEYIKKEINYFYNEKIKNIIKETNQFISNLNSNNYLYIVSHLNNSYIFEDYIKSRLKYLNNTFKKYNNKLLSNALYSNNNNTILNNLNYDLKINNIIYNYANFTKNFQKNLNEEFIIFSNCINNTEQIYNYNSKNLECNIEYYESDLNYSKYNFQIIKIRNSLNISKNIFEELNMIYKESQDDENYFSNIIDINMKYIKEKDYKINEKNIWEIYRENLDFLN